MSSRAIQLQYSSNQKSILVFLCFNIEVKEKTRFVSFHCVKHQNPQTKNDAFFEM